MSAAERGGLYGRDGVAEGLGFDPNRRRIRGDHAQVRVVLVPVCLDRMTSGAQASVTAVEKEENSSGREGVRPWPEAGLGRSAAPRPFQLFSFFFFFSFLFLL
jgi:hypothetical protein